MDRLDVNDRHYDSKYNDYQRRLDAFYDEIADIDASIKDEQDKLQKSYEMEASQENAIRILHLSRIILVK